MPVSLAMAIEFNSDALSSSSLLFDALPSPTCLCLQSHRLPSTGPRRRVPPPGGARLGLILSGSCVVETFDVWRGQGGRNASRVLSVLAMSTMDVFDEVARG